MDHISISLLERGHYYGRKKAEVKVADEAHRLGELPGGDKMEALQGG